MNYLAIDRRLPMSRLSRWRHCRVLIYPCRRRAARWERGLVQAWRFSARPANCLVLFAGDTEPVVRPWRGIRRAA
jgi:hypothetical protein